MTQIIPFESSALPAYLTKFKFEGNELNAGTSGFPQVSIKGKVFTVKRGGTGTIITRPDDPTVPAFSIEVVILNANPGNAKNWYEKGYTEGSDDKPSCYSIDGVSPAPDAILPQAAKCITCPKGVYGSKINDDGSKGFECSNSKRLAIATVGAVEDPMILRVPGASLKALNAYADKLARRGTAYQQVVTKISFDATVAHPQLTFDAIGFLDETALSRVFEMSRSNIVGQIIGTVASPSHDAPPEVPSAPTPAPAAKASAPKPAPKAAAPKPEPIPEPEPATAELDIDSELENINWDD